MRRQTFLLIVLFVIATACGTAYHQYIRGQILIGGITVDDGDLDYMQSPPDAFWQRQTLGERAYMSDVTIRPTAKYAPEATATYNFNSVAGNEYEVYATWPSNVPISPSLATDVPYTVQDSTGKITTFTVNQNIAPTGPLMATRPFQLLGTFTAREANFRVVINSNANGGIFVAADAVRVALAGTNSSVSSVGGMARPQPYRVPFFGTSSQASSPYSSQGNSSQTNSLAPQSSSTIPVSSALAAQCAQDTDCGETRCNIRQSGEACSMECAVYICHMNQCISRLKNLACPQYSSNSSVSFSSIYSASSSSVDACVLRPDLCASSASSASAQSSSANGSPLLSVVQDSTPIRQRQLLAGTREGVVMRLEVRAGPTEPIDITSLPILLVDSIGSSIDRLELYREGEATPFAAATRGTCEVLQEQGTFCASITRGAFTIPAGGSTDILVRPLMRADDNGAVSGEKERFALTTSMVVRGKGKLSGADVSASPPLDSVTPLHVTVLAKLASITNANPDTNGTAIPTGVTTPGQFRFTALTHTNAANGMNDWSLNAVIFNVNAVNVMVNGNSLRFYNKANSTVYKQCVAMDLSGTVLQGSVTGAFHAYCSQLKQSPLEVYLNSGESQVFALQMEVTNPRISNTNSSALQVSLQNFTNSALTTFTPVGSHLDWSDSDTMPTEPFRWVEYAEETVRSTAYQN